MAAVIVRAGPTYPAASLRSVTKADAPLPDGPCRSLLCGTAGTVNLRDMSGEILTSVPLQQGFNPIGAQEVRTGGTATDIWALY